MDTSATRHIYGNRNMFLTYTPNNGDEKLYMGNATAATVAGKRESGSEIHFGERTCSYGCTTCP